MAICVPASTFAVGARVLWQSSLGDASLLPSTVPELTIVVITPAPDGAVLQPRARMLGSRHELDHMVERGHRGRPKPARAGDIIIAPAGDLAGAPKSAAQGAAEGNRGDVIEAADAHRVVRSMRVPSPSSPDSLSPQQSRAPSDVEVHARV